MRVLVAFDGSDGARAAVEDLRVAGLPPDVEALVLCCADVPAQAPTYAWVPVEGGGVVTESSVLAAREAVDREMRHAASTAAAGADLVASAFPGWTVHADSVGGTPYWQIVQKASALPADLVVLGSHGRSIVSRLFFGSVSQNVLAHAPCSVRIGRIRTDPPSEVGRPIRVLLGVDGSVDSAAAVDAVCSRSWPVGSEVRVATVSDTRLSLDMTYLVMSADARHRVSPIQRLVHSVGDRLHDCRTGVSTVILEGDPKRALVQEAEKWGADCMFVGARGHGRLERILVGSVSSSVAARATCSVEVVRRPV